MDYEDLRTILETTGVDVWTLMDTAIAVASADYASELKRRRDGIVERLYATSYVPPQCLNCIADVPNRSSGNQANAVSPYTPQFIGRNDDEEEDEEGLDPYAGLFDDEQKNILDIKRQLEDPHLSEDSLVELLQSLVDMEISYQELKEADIGRHVSQLRKQHPNDAVKRLAKQVVRKWKASVDDWVKLHGEQPSSSAVVDGDSPQQKIPQNGLHQITDFAHSPNLHNGSPGSDRNNSEPERKPKAVPRGEPPPKRAQSTPVSTSAPLNRQRGQKEIDLDADKLASARKRLQANYREAENAKKQRTIQVMDIHDIPKRKNSFISKSKGGGGSGSHHGRHW